MTGWGGYFYFGFFYHYQIHHLFVFSSFFVLIFQESSDLFRMCRDLRFRSHFFHFSPYLYLSFTSKSKSISASSCFFKFTKDLLFFFFLVLSTLKQIYSAPSLVATLILCHRQLEWLIYHLSLDYKI